MSRSVTCASREWVGVERSLRQRLEPAQLVVVLLAGDRVAVRQVEPADPNRARVADHPGQVAGQAIQGKVLENDGKPLPPGLERSPLDLQEYFITLMEEKDKEDVG